MRANLEFIRLKFIEFNDLCFENKLPPIPLRIGNARRSMGTFTYPLHYDKRLKRGVGECRITISQRFDRPQAEIEDTLIHEMIHYWKWMERLDGESSHGPIFVGKMNLINSTFGRNISVRHVSDEDLLDSDRHYKAHFICVTHWQDGSLAISICARTRIFELNRLWLSQTKVKNVEWFASADPWFNRFPVARSGKAYRLSKEDYEKHISTAYRCEISGGIFRVINYPHKR